ncbi:MAG TPA: substrate-binding domain-containing protein [Tepidisphaeraceae bacterium]
MRHSPTPDGGPRKRPIVALVADGTTGFGRAALRGAMRYANIKRRWQIHEELRNVHTLPVKDWPEFDGAILAGVAAELVQYVKRRSGHLIVCTGTGNPQDAPVASLNDYEVGVMAAEHLLDCRLTRFAYYGLSPMQTSQNRHKGFVETIRTRGFECLDIGLGWLPPGQIMEHETLPKLVHWLRTVEKPIGIMAVDDSQAHDLATVCLEAEISVPDGVAIIGVNNDDLLCESTWPPISSVDGDYSRVGYAAASMLDRLLGGEKLVGEDRAVRLSPLRVVRRQSTDLLAISDPDVSEAVRYIREHACDPCNVEDVLAHVPVGRRWMERQFAKYLGRSPYDEILRVRVENAKRLLLMRELRLEEISARCGFSVVQQFRRAFLRATGKTPGAFRTAANAVA